MTRYFFIVLILMLCGVGAIFKGGLVMFRDKGYWIEVKKIYTKNNVPIEANRGNIFSSDGKLMASSLPEYRIYMDFKTGNPNQEIILKENLTEISKRLHKVLPKKSEAYFRNKLVNGLKRGSRYDLLYPYRITYIDLQKLKQIPLFNKSRNISGLIAQEFNQRKKPFGSLATRTLGSLYADKTEGAKNGIEYAFDEVLRGKNGVAHRQKVRNKYLSITDIEPIHGDDVITTLNVDFQDISEKALVDKLKAINGKVGIAMIMEVATGDVKAIVNMTKGRDGVYREEINNAIADMYEPGSTIKTASIMLALDDGKITPETSQFLGNGVHNLYGSELRDHNWRRGGFEEKYLNITDIMKFSSNIGVGLTIEEAYANNKQQFVDGLRKLVGTPLELQIPGAGHPIIKDASDPSFSKISLAWMSFGYETQMPAVNMLTFYNAIANNGVMMKPRFVKAISRNGSIIKKHPTEVLNPSISSKNTLKEIQRMLVAVVEDGTGKSAGSSQFKVAGKTGTAQISQGSSGYTNGRRQHLLSFCGYFPADNPKYSCIINIKTEGPHGSREPAEVFREIAERIYAKDLKQYYNVTTAIDTVNTRTPDIKRGLTKNSLNVLKGLDIKYVLNKNEDQSESTIWSQFKPLAQNIEVNPSKISTTTIPSVYGMGAKDAIYALESIGLQVVIRGKGKVYRQSIPNGSTPRKGAKIILDLRQ